MNSLRIASLIVLIAAPAISNGEDLTADELSFFETKIRPVLVRECYGCHSNKSGNVRGGLRLDTKELTAIGGASGPSVVPGNLEESWLYNAITHQDYVMPPKRKLPQNVINDFRAWIEMGAPDPRVNNIAEVKSAITSEDIKTAKETFWAYQNPKRPQQPSVNDTAWPRTPIDHHVLSSLEASELQPADDAEAWKILRRLKFDLVGLPPTPKEIGTFTQQWKQNPDQAISDVVDRLLDTPQFGERWGRHWLDVVRYAESTGREVNMTYPHAWRYRDYVIDSFNNDKPFDRFIQEQIAGDLLPVKTDEQWASNLVATTFLAIGPKNINEQNPVQFAADVVDEQIDATTRIFLGTSVACARCHDHKFDAIPQSDYYALAGIFGNTTTYFGNVQSEYGSFSSAQAKQNSSLIILPVEDASSFDKSYNREELTALKQQMTDKQEEMRDSRRNRGREEATKDSQRERLRLMTQLQEISGKLGIVDPNGKPISYCMGVQELDSPSNERLLVRGEIDKAAQTIQRGLPQVLCSSSVAISKDKSGRLELARWISSDENPLTARVMVNRIWLQMIGRGIVTSTENFGVTGQPPSHPELLDYLAVRFVESDWSVKAMIREIATSRVYRMQTTFDQDNHETDPDNALAWRANPRRLDAEAIRDAMLQISDEIDLERPRGSEVAKAGYVRVQLGQLGNARSARMSMGSSRPGMRDSGQPMNGQRRQGQRPGERGPREGSAGERGRMMSRGSGAGQRSGTRPTNPLDMEDAKFRSVYLPIVRDEEPRSLEVFDFADSSAIIGQREASNTANQALYMMNNPFVLQQSGAFANRIADLSSRPGQQIELAFLLAYGRPPTSDEMSVTLKFARSFASSTNFRSARSNTLQAICQGLFASAEFRFID